MDLQTISAQMKIVIQKHQIVVTEMRNDPQDPVLQKRLHDLQLEIHSLNERQKQIVEDLRKNLENKQASPNSSPNNSSGFPVAPLQPHIPKQEAAQVLCPSPKYSPPNHKISTTTLVASKPAPINTIRQPVPPSTTFTFKAPLGTVVLPTSNKVEHSKILVVPSPSNHRAADVVFNIVPPIRVPQYTPPTNRNAAPATCQKNQVLNNCIPVSFNTNQSNCNTETKPQFSVKDSTFHEKHNFGKIDHKIDPKKKAFMLSLGLVSKETFTDIKNKKLERKRRTTANPQFSNAALEEKWRNAAAAQAGANPHKRPRGRPRLESKQVLMPLTHSNGISSSELPNNNNNNIKPGSPAPDCNSANLSSSSSPESDNSVIMNGTYQTGSNSEDGKTVEQLLSGLCLVCTQPGDLVKCDTCAKQQHPGCMQPPLVTRPQGAWQCSECQSRAVSLIVMQSYDAMKTAKEDEKKKLLKKSLELRLKRSQLESRLSQLRELSTKQKNRQSELQASLKEVDSMMKIFGDVIQDLRKCS